MRAREYAYLMACLLLALGGCARNVAVMSAPNLNVYTSYTEKVPGKWLLFVNATQLHRDVRPDGIACAAYSYPLDLSSSFRQSVTGTFQNLVDEVQVVDQAPSMEALQAGGYRGLVRVNGDDLRTRLSYAHGFFSATAEVTVEIDAGIIVDGPAGRILGTQATGTGRSDHDAGTFCDGTGPGVSEASEAALKMVLGQLAERFANNPKTRDLKN